MVFTDGFVFMLQSPEAALDYMNFSDLRRRFVFSSLSTDCCRQPVLGNRFNV